MNHRAIHHARRGLGQVEVVVSSLIVGLIVVGALNVLGAATQTNRIAADQLDAPGLAHQLLGEILALPYEDPENPGSAIGSDSGESNGSRADWDDVDDYDNWDKSPPETKDATTVPGFDSWRRLVFINYVDTTTGSNTGSDTGVKSIRVQIIVPGGGTFELKALRCKWGSLQQPPGLDTTMITSLDAQLQIGSTSEPAFASIHLKNHAND